MTVARRSALWLATAVVLLMQLSAWGLLVLLSLALACPGQAHAQAPQAVAALAQPLRAAPHLGPLRREAQRVWGLQAPVATFAAQVHQESSWRADARSPVGALGLAQFMPATAQWIGALDAGLAERAPLNPAWAVRALVVYDHWLHRRIAEAADGCQRMAFTLAAYNGGLGWVFKRQAMARATGVDAAVCMGAACALNPGVGAAAQAENERYPRAIFAREAQYLRWGAGSCLA